MNVSHQLKSNSNDNNQTPKAKIGFSDLSYKVILDIIDNFISGNASFRVCNLNVMTKKEERTLLSLNSNNFTITTLNNNPKTKAYSYEKNQQKISFYEGMEGHYQVQLRLSEKKSYLLHFESNYEAQLFLGSFSLYQSYNDQTLQFPQLYGNLLSTLRLESDVLAKRCFQNDHLQFSIRLMIPYGDKISGILSLAKKGLVINLNNGDLLEFNLCCCLISIYETKLEEIINFHNLSESNLLEHNHNTNNSNNDNNSNNENNSNNDNNHESDNYESTKTDNNSKENDPLIQIVINTVQGGKMLLVECLDQKQQFLLLNLLRMFVRRNKNQSQLAEPPKNLNSIVTTLSNYHFHIPTEIYHSLVMNQNGFETNGNNKEKTIKNYFQRIENNSKINITNFDADYKGETFQPIQNGSIYQTELCNSGLINFSKNKHHLSRIIKSKIKGYMLSGKGDFEVNVLIDKEFYKGVLRLNLNNSQILIYETKNTKKIPQLIEKKNKNSRIKYLKANYNLKQNFFFHPIRPLLLFKINSKVKIIIKTNQYQDRDLIYNTFLTFRNNLFNIKNNNSIIITTPNINVLKKNKEILQMKKKFTHTKINLILKKSKFEYNKNNINKNNNNKNNNNDNNNNNNNKNNEKKKDNKIILEKDIILEKEEETEEEDVQNYEEIERAFDQIESELTKTNYGITIYNSFQENIGHYRIELKKDHFTIFMNNQNNFSRRYSIFSQVLFYSNHSLIVKFLLDENYYITVGFSDPEEKKGFLRDFSYKRKKYLQNALLTLNEFNCQVITQFGNLKAKLFINPDNIKIITKMETMALPYNFLTYLKIDKERKSDLILNLDHNEYLTFNFKNLKIQKKFIRSFDNYRKNYLDKFIHENKKLFYPKIINNGKLLENCFIKFKLGKLMILSNEMETIKSELDNNTQRLGKKNNKKKKNTIKSEYSDFSFGTIPDNDNNIMIKNEEEKKQNKVISAYDLYKHQCYFDLIENYQIKIQFFDGNWIRLSFNKQQDFYDFTEARLTFDCEKQLKQQYLNIFNAQQINKLNSKPISEGNISISHDYVIMKFKKITKSKNNAHDDVRSKGGDNTSNENGNIKNVNKSYLIKEPLQNLKIYQNMKTLNMIKITNIKENLDYYLKFEKKNQYLTFTNLFQIFKSNIILMDKELPRISQLGIEKFSINILDNEFQIINPNAKLIITHDFLVLQFSKKKIKYPRNSPIVINLNKSLKNIVKLNILEDNYIISFITRYERVQFVVLMEKITINQKKVKNLLLLKNTKDQKEEEDLKGEKKDKKDKKDKKGKGEKGEKREKVEEDAKGEKKEKRDNKEKKDKKVKKMKKTKTGEMANNTENHEWKIRIISDKEKKIKGTIQLSNDSITIQNHKKKPIKYKLNKNIIIKKDKKSSVKIHLALSKKEKQILRFDTENYSKEFVQQFKRIQKKYQK
ncbi:nnp-1 protein putative nuclear protein 1 nop52 [Anaeramoeba flamelloides]|uniref:Nnp-1 protein putative nuclear protein 1 nop52 n=1 Tax=Anaeramoeba flamelloides TaxID=1746091 RepID=A0AAV7YKJ1_9EUKA|nr:nnp-1 protein putative nuclear protein 1 nop52 [Anaeramoeba flamelloides]